MDPEVFELWTDAIAELADAEAAELGVVALYKHQAQRPRIADIIGAYQTQRRLQNEAERDEKALSEPAPTQTRRAMIDGLLAKLAKMGDNIGGYNHYGRVCLKHQRWVSRWQTSDPCFSHVWDDLTPETVDADLKIALPPCGRCGTEGSECGHLAEMWQEELDERTKALIKKRGEARDARRAML